MTVIRYAVVLIIFLIFLPAPIPAQDMDVSVDIQLSLLTKVLTYDRSFEPRNPGVVVIGVLYHRFWNSSARVLDQIEKYAGETKLCVSGHKVQIVPIDITEDVEVTARFNTLKIDILYIAPLRGISLNKIIAATRKLHIRSLTGVPEYNENGVSLGVEVRRERPGLVINRSAARAEGADIASQVLGLSRVIE